MAEHTNRCEGGPLHGYMFSLERLTLSISYKNGHYRRSAIQTDGITLWHWHENDEEQEPAVNPQ